MFFVQILEGIEARSLCFRRYSVRVVEVENRLAAAAELDTLIRGWQEAAGEVRCASAGSYAGTEDGESGQILRLAAQAVGSPCAEGRAAELDRAGHEKKLAGVVIEGVRVHGADEANVVGTLGGMGQVVGKCRSAFAVGFEDARAAEDCRGGLDEGQFQVFGHRRR